MSCKFVLLTAHLNLLITIAITDVVASANVLEVLIRLLPLIGLRSDLVPNLITVQRLSLAAHLSLVHLIDRIVTFQLQIFNVKFVVFELVVLWGGTTKILLSLALLVTASILKPHGHLEFDLSDVYVILVLKSVLNYLEKIIFWDVGLIVS